MPLSKLWNSIRGRSAPSNSAAKRDESQAAVRQDRSGPGEGNKKSSGGFSLFGRGRHAGLCKLVNSSIDSLITPAKTSSGLTVLEISVDDGSRAVALLETLAKRRLSIHYVAIDQFELADGGVTLKEFHQKLRAQQIGPQLFPGTISRSLVRVARTVGTVDVVVIAADVESWQKPSILPLISRVSHDKTIVLYRDLETWKRLANNTGCSRQRAA